MSANWHRGLLTGPQAALVEQWLHCPLLIEDLSWGLTDTRVLRLRSLGRDYILKTAGSANLHLGREFKAHTGYTAPLLEHGLTAAMRHEDRAQRLLLLDYLPGVLCEQTPSANNPDIHEQAGRALRLLHGQYAKMDDGYEKNFITSGLSWLEAEHRIDPPSLAAARRIFTGYRPAPIVVVPTHGDWQPRNWVVEQGKLRVIDFGRFALRPAQSDLARLSAQQWREHPELATAFFHGYGTDPREPRSWPITQLREAIGTAVWAFQVGDTAFETQGHRMLRDALELF
ncbi:phosphotransferase family protein [Glutamicibacter sp. 287]|uniref:phosphotransferase n=1 Tax=unclassified Glutamicibacter TaxID=2627139 RepID=UPI000BB97407|nr:phosphotransferase [Glutamicibacter sp. BW80]PCC28519.1 aminoglycoside phosphotransferase [Glutamicibacter sp. BW80]